ncbi:MAG: beta-glucosidase BglX [Bacteroidetes bacterium]|nr:beta-glucosidase BglX [Bacteroidota bacterium]
MKTLAATILLILGGLTIGVAQQADPKMDQFISDLMKKMTLEEKIGQLNLPGSGDIVTGQASNSDIGRKIKEGKVGGLFNIKSAEKIRAVQKVAVEESRLKIPMIFGMDVIHGYQTVFPIPLGLSSTWDLKAIERSARIAAQEASADGIAWTFSPMVDLSRDPRWGRVAEGSGEDPYLGGEIAKAMVRGYQGNDLKANNTILACVKHYALYGAPDGGRDYNTVDMSRYRMYNEYFPPYKAAVDAGVGSVMASFNEVDGIPATGNKWLMTDVLRTQWGFGGFVVTDYTGINEMIDHGMGNLQQVSVLALNAGIDMDMVGEGLLTTLQQSLKEGKITEAQIDQACRRILEAKYKLGLFEDPYRYCDPKRAKTEVYTDSNRKEARAIAASSFVLLKNDKSILPLKKSSRVALVGPLADAGENMFGTWSVAAEYSRNKSVLTAFRERFGAENILYAKGANVYAEEALEARVSIFGKPTGRDNRPEAELIADALKASEKADVVVAVMGEAAEMSGESSSRSDIELPSNQRRLLEALIKTGKPVAMVLFTGRPLALKWEQENVPAILNVWFGGSEAADAVTDVVLGDVNPGGKLTMTFPQNVGQVPIFYNHKNTGRPLLPGRWFEKFRSNYLDVSNDPLYPFGFGLSYTTFSYSDLRLSGTELTSGGSLTATVTVTNTGSVAGHEVVQFYIRDLVGSVTRPVKELKGFEKIYLKPGESREVRFTITEETLKFYNYDLKLVAEPGDFKVFAGGNSRDVKEAGFVLK